MTDTLNTFRYVQAGDTVRLETSETLTLKTWEMLRRVVEIIKPGNDEPPKVSSPWVASIKATAVLNGVIERGEQTIHIGEVNELIEIVVGRTSIVADYSDLIDAMLYVHEGAVPEESPAVILSGQSRPERLYRNNPNPPPAESDAQQDPIEPTTQKNLPLKPTVELSTAQDEREKFSHQPAENEDEKMRGLVMQRANSGPFYAEDIVLPATKAFGRRIFSPAIRRIINQLVYRKTLAFTVPADGTQRRYHLPEAPPIERPQADTRSIHRT